jgi:hypothetical protein
LELSLATRKVVVFNLHKSHLADPSRLTKLMIAACLAYLWIIYLGMTALQTNHDKLIHRTDRSDWSIFRMGLAFLDYCLSHDLPLPVSFCLLNIKSVRCSKGG